MSKLCSIYYSAGGTFVAPAGVTQVWLLGHAGGTGGDGGQNVPSGLNYGGIGCIPTLVQVTVVPNTSYTVTIGAGGTGGPARTTSTPNGGVGGSTSFGALYTWAGGGPFSYPTPKLGWTGIPISNAAASAVYSGYEIKLGGSTNASSYSGGTSGAPGYSGSVAGSGGNANAAGTGAAGGNATGFGAGGGAGGAGSTGGGIGGNGAPGQLWVIWAE